MMLRSNKTNKGTVLFIMIVIKMLNTFRDTQMVQADNFDIKATLLKHREEHINHLNKDFAYDHFRRLDQHRIKKLQVIIADHERRFLEFGHLEENEKRTLLVAKARRNKLLSESLEETQERYAELHEAMQSEHILGLTDLDFTRTGLK